MTEASQHPEEALDEINLLDVLEFLVAHARQILLGAAAGLLLAVLGWMGLVQYKAQVILNNQGAISFVGWKTLNKTLPMLADQVLEAGKVPGTEQDQIRRMSDPQWWSKNVQPTLSLSKADTKELAAMSKQMTEAGGDNILNFVVSATAGSKQAAEQDVAVAARFMQQGVAYLSLQNLVSGYETTVLNTESDLARRIVQTQIELKYQQERVRNLERLRDRFPGNTGAVSQQVVDLVDSNAKYMPISTQLVAVQTDINQQQEQLKRMEDQLARTRVLSTFVAEAKPRVTQEFNGLALADQLLAIEKTLRKTVDAADINAQQALNSLQADIVGIKTFFSKGLEVRLAPSTGNSTGVLAPAAAGLLLGLLAGLAWAAWPIVRQKLQPRRLA